MGAFPVSLSFVDENTGWLTNYGSVIKYTVPQCPVKPVNILSSCCTVFESIKSGSWSDPATWSCNRVPVSTDDVIINVGHTVSTPANNIFAKTLNNRGGVLQIHSSINLKLGN